MKNVLEFIPTLFNGGAEALVREYAINFDKNKINAKFLTIWDSSGYQNAKLLKEKNISYDFIFRRNLFFRAINKFFGDFFIKKYINKYLKKNKIEIIHSHLDAINYLSPSFLKAKNIKVFYTIHSEPRCYFEKDTYIRRSIYKLFNSGVDLTIIALTKKARDEVYNKYKITKVEYLYNGIDIDRFYNCNIDIKAYKNKLAIPLDSFVIGTIGRLTEAKNPFFIVKVFYECLKMNNKSFLVWVGEGELFDEVKTTIHELGIADRILFLSNRTDIPQIMRCFDVFLLPSIYEGLAIVTIEAQASNVNIVCSSTIPNEIAVKDICMLDINSAPKKWANSVLHFESNQKKVNDITEFDIKNVTDKLTNIFNQN